ncbi:MAG: hypothetical protein ABJC89_21400 [Acidobacteriota bacterium]
MPATATAMRDVTEPKPVRTPKGKAKSRVEVLAAEFQKLTEQEANAELTLEEVKAKREAKRKELVEESSRKRK